MNKRAHYWIGIFIVGLLLLVTIGPVSQTSRLAAATQAASNGSLNDGRLNASDPWQTSAVYCLADGSVSVYVPSMPTWIIAFTASPADIAKVATAPMTNTRIEQDKGARLYRLTTGELQVNSPGLNPADGDYVFIFHDCPKTQ